MKLVRYGEAGKERPGIWLDGAEPRIVDVRGMAFDIGDYDARFWATGGPGRLRGLLDDPGLKTVPAAGVRLGPPVARPGQVVCLGKNFAEHAAEFDGRRRGRWRGRGTRSGCRRGRRWTGRWSWRWWWGGGRGG